MITRFRFCIKIASCSCYRSTLTREARMLQKMINKSLASNVKPQNHGNKIVYKRFLPGTPFDNENPNLRMVSLNKSYMEFVTEILHGVKCSKEIADLQIEVIKVNLSKDLQFLNVYFISKKVGTLDKILKEVLSKTLPEIQMRLGEISQFPRVPHIKFIRDITAESAVHAEKLFSILDYGKDYQPLHEKKVVMKDSAVKQDGFPEMRQNVFGVDVGQIKQRIQAKIIRFKVINIKDTYSECEIPSKLMTFNKKDFIKFFKKRRIAELKRRKMEQKKVHPLYNMFENASEMSEDEYESEEFDELDSYDKLDEADEYDEYDEYDEHKFENDKKISK